MEKEFKYIGKRVAKVDAYEKVTGAGVYGHDFSLPGMLHAKILRSEYPHAKILEIDTSRAKRLPGVHAVITAKDIKCGKLGFLEDNPVLKGDKVRSYRDEVAAVAAISEEIAEEACRLIKVKYAPLPAVFDPFEAMKPSAPLIHENLKNNLVPWKYEFKSGDVESALKNSAYKVEGEFKTRFVTHCCMATCFCLAKFVRDGSLDIYSTTQVPYLLQHRVARVLGISGHKIRVRQLLIGGAFGSKLDVYPYEIITILLAQITGRPVRLLYTREEEFECSPTRQPAVIRMTTGCDKHGRLTARKFDAILDNGAYTSWGVTTPHIMAIGISSLYQVENVHFKAQSVYTNNPYSTAMRGYGNPESTFANEQQMDELAHQIGMDPVEFRLLNANQPNTITPQKFRITTCGLSECIKKAADRIEFKKKKAPYEGVGIASMLHVGGGGRVYRSDACGVIAKLDDFGRLSILTGATEIGTGSDTAMAIIAAEELGLPLDAINVINTDTDVGPWDVGIHASRTTFIAGKATLLACKEIKNQLLPEAVKMIGCEPDECIFKDGNILSKNNPEKSVPIAKVVRAMHFREQGKMVIGTAFYDPPNEFQTPELVGNISSTYAFATHAVRIKIDKETGKIKVLKFVAVHDVGRVINRLGLEGQIEGAIAQGLGYALTEEIKLDKGKVLNNSYLDYKLILSRDMPRDIEIHFIETNDPEGPYGAKGVSEAGLIPIAPAVANAIFDAIGVRIRELPLTPEKILRALKKLDK